MSDVCRKRIVRKSRIEGTNLYFTKSIDGEWTDV
jgi:hypothetical protein